MKFVSKIDASSRLAKLTSGSEANMVKGFIEHGKVKNAFGALVKAAQAGKSFNRDVSFSEDGEDWNVELTWNPSSNKASISIAGFNEEGMEWDTGVETAAITKQVMTAMGLKGNKAGGFGTKQKADLQKVANKLIKSLEKDSENPLSKIWISNVKTQLQRALSAGGGEKARDALLRLAYSASDSGHRDIKDQIIKIADQAGLSIRK